MVYLMNSKRVAGALAISAHSDYVGLRHRKGPSQDRHIGYRRNKDPCT